MYQAIYSSDLWSHKISSMGLSTSVFTEECQLCLRIHQRSNKISTVRSTDSVGINTGILFLEKCRALNIRANKRGIPLIPSEMYLFGWSMNEKHKLVYNFIKRT